MPPRRSLSLRLHNAFDVDRFLGGGATKAKQHSDATRHHEVFTRLRKLRDSTMERFGLGAVLPPPLPPQQRPARVYYRRVYQRILNDLDGLTTVQVGAAREMAGPRRGDGWAKEVEIEREGANIFSLDGEGNCLPQRHRSKVPGQEKPLSHLRDGDIMCFHCGDLRKRCVYMVVDGDPQQAESVALAPEADLRRAVPDYAGPRATAGHYRKTYSVWGAVTVARLRRMIPLAGSVARRCRMPEAAARLRAAGGVASADLGTGAGHSDGWLASDDDVMDVSSGSGSGGPESGGDTAGPGSSRKGARTPRDGSGARARLGSVDEDLSSDWSHCTLCR